MNNQPKELFNSNYTFVKNNETYNQKLFDRNFLSSQMAQIPNSDPKYFNIQHEENKKNAEQIFNNRFLNLENKGSGGKMGYVDFSDTRPQVKKKSNTMYQFDKNYGEHINKIENHNNLAYARNSDRLTNNRSSLKREEYKGR